MFKKSLLPILIVVAVCFVANLAIAQPEYSRFISLTGTKIVVTLPESVDPESEDIEIREVSGEFEVYFLVDAPTLSMNNSTKVALTGRDWHYADLYRASASSHLMRITEEEKQLLVSLARCPVDPNIDPTTCEMSTRAGTEIVITIDNVFESRRRR